MTEFLLLLLLLFLSAFFSGSETALTALSRGRAEALAKEQRRGARALAALKREPQRMLVAILIGNNVVNIGASALATVIATRELGRLGPGLAVGVLTILVLVFGEITPKSIATRYSERISLIVAPIILTFLRLITPLVWLFQGIADLVDKATPVDEQDPIVTESELISMVGFG
ncbi:MAG TPA: hemolysin, partial [Gammaproteobacteria bacterium]|nr:hemolysin [Gammaproteobacteria bacterium]